MNARGERYCRWRTTSLLPVDPDRGAKRAGKDSERGGDLRRQRVRSTLAHQQARDRERAQGGRNESQALDRGQLPQQRAELGAAGPFDDEGEWQVHAASLAHHASREASREPSHAGLMRHGKRHAHVTICNLLMFGPVRR